MKLPHFLQKDKRRLDILMLLVLGLIVFTWFDKDYIFTTGDFLFNLNPTFANLKRFFYVWSEYISLGLFNNAQSLPDIFPNQLVIFVLHKLGLPVWLIQRLIFYYLFTLAGIGMYSLVNYLFKDRIPAFLSALAYMFNPFVMIIGWRMVGPTMYFYPFVPLFLLFYIKLLNSKEYFKYIFYLTIVFAISLPAAKVAIFPILAWFVMLPYLFYFIITNLGHKLRIKDALLKTVILVLAWLAINGLWLIPYLYNLSWIIDNAFSAVGVSSDPAKHLAGATAVSNILNTLTQFTYQPFFQKFMGIDWYYNYSQVFRTPIFSILRFIPGLLAVSALIFTKKGKERGTILFFSFLLLIFVYISKGTNPPFYNPLVYLVRHNAVFAALRNPINKIGVLLAFCLAVLFSFSIWKLFILLRKKLKSQIWLASVFLGGVLVLVNVVLVFPLWSGQTFRSTGQIYKSAQIKVPDEYRLAGEWLAKESDCQYRMVSLPMQGWFGLPLNWKAGYDSLDPKFYFFCNPNLTASDKTLELIKIILIRNNLPPDSLHKLAGLLSVKYLLVHNDVATDYFNINAKTFATIKERLAVNYFKNLKPRVSFGQLDLYEFDSDFVRPKIYTPSYLLLPNQLESTIFARLLERQEFVPGTVVTTGVCPRSFLGSSLKFKYLEPPLMSTKEDPVAVEKSSMLPRPKFLKFKKINPTRYEVKVKNYPNNFLLIFNEKFSEGWRAYVIPKGNSKSSYTTTFLSPQKCHFTANMAVNGWLIETPTGDSFEIVIEFYYQKLAYIGFLLSLLTLPVLGALMHHEKRKKSKN